MCHGHQRDVGRQQDPPSPNPGHRLGRHSLASEMPNVKKCPPEWTELVSLHFTQLAWNKISIFSYCVKSEIEAAMLRCGQEALSDLLSSGPHSLPATQTSAMWSVCTRPWTDGQGVALLGLDCEVQHRRRNKERVHRRQELE